MRYEGAVQDLRERIRERNLSLFTGAVLLVIALGTLLFGILSHPGSKPETRLSLLTWYAEPEYVCRLPAVSSDAPVLSMQAEFPTGLAVTATVDSVLPDEYFIPGDGTPYRILVLTLSEVLRGHGLPEQGYLLIPSRFPADSLSRYDLILSLKQIGIENYLLFNRSTGHAEAFSLLFSCASPSGTPACGALLPFSEGVFDDGLWDLPGWSDSASLIRNLPESFPVRSGDSMKDAVRAVKKLPEDLSAVDRVFSSADLGAPEVFTQLLPFLNGTYAQTSSFTRTGDGCSAEVTYRRLIRGIGTDEVYVLKTDGTVQSSGVTLREDELPDLAAFLESETVSSLLPSSGTVSGRIGSGRYVSANGTTFAAAKIVLSVTKEDGTQGEEAFFFLLDPDGTPVPMSGEELRQTVGADPFAE